MARALVKRREHDVEALEDAIGKVETAVGKDVDLAAVQDRDLRIQLAQPGNFVGLPRDRIHREVPRRGGMRRMVGNRHVLVAESAAHLHHRFDRVAAVAELGVHVEIAADVALRQQRRQRAALRGLDLVLAVANLRRE